MQEGWIDRRRGSRMRRGDIGSWWGILVHGFIGFEVLVIIHLGPCYRCCMSVDDTSVGSIIFDFVLFLGLLLESF